MFRKYPAGRAAGLFISTLRLTAIIGGVDEFVNTPLAFLSSAMYKRAKAARSARYSFLSHSGAFYDVSPSPWHY